MSPADGISKLGFRRWYERQLIESHGCLVTGFMCLILIAASFEGFSIRDASASTFITLATMFAAGLVGCGALKRYIDVLQRAEHIAEHSVCASCSTYGRLTVLGASSAQSAADDVSTSWMRVACRKCGHEWLID